MDASNAVMVAVASAMTNMGLNIPLIWTQIASAFQNEAKGLLGSLGLDIKGNDVQSIVESFKEEIKKSGAVQRCEILEVSEDRIKIDIGECIYSSATKIIRGDDVTKIPPCPMMAILYASLNEKLGKTCVVESALYRPELNASIFTVSLE